MSELLPEEIPDDILEPIAPIEPDDADEPVVPDDILEPVAPDDADRLVPIWLAALVLGLLFAVMALGGYALRGIFESDRPSTNRDLEVERWEEQVKLTPDDMEARVSLAFAYQQAKRFEDALEQYDLAIRENPRDTAALYNTGLIYRQLDRDKDAEETWWVVLEIEPGHVLAAKSLGELYAERREYRSLLEAVRPVVEENESSADLQYLVGLAYENLGRSDWARIRYELALKYYPDMKEAREGLKRLGTEQ
jgi:tetratricopeptide (TPR) repeat protein